MARTLLAALALTLTLAGVADAHGYAKGSVPAASSRLPDAPTEVVVRMSEPVELRASKVEVVDRSGANFATGAAYHPDGDASLLASAVALPGNGTYVVLWTANWISDGHTTHGGFGFVVGAGALEPPAIEQASALPDAADAALLAGTLGGIALALGPLLFLLVVWSPADPLRGRVLLLAAGAALVASLASLGTLLVQSSAAGAGLAAYATEFRAGRLLLARAALFAGAAALALAARAKPRLRPAALALGAAGALAVSLGSHAASAGTGLVVADFAHVLAASAWAGGLVALLLVVSIAPAEAFLRWSAVATLAVVGVVASGLVASSAHVGSPERLLGTDYGRVLLVKLGLVACMLALGGANRLFFVKRPGSADRRARFRRLVAVETVMGLLVLGAAGVLAQTDPNPTTGPDRGFSAEKPGESDEKPVTIALSLEPAAVGLNVANVTVTHAANDTAVTTVKRLQLFLNRPDRSVPTQTLDLDDAGNGRFTGNVTFAMPGVWRVTVAVQRTDAFDDAASFEIDIR